MNDSDMEKFMDLDDYLYYLTPIDYGIPTENLNKLGCKISLKPLTSLDKKDQLDKNGNSLKKPEIRGFSEKTSRVGFFNHNETIKEASGNDTLHIGLTPNFSIDFLNLKKMRKIDYQKQKKKVSKSPIMNAAFQKD